MIQIRPARQRGHANHGWLDSWHSFSFADYVDPAHGGWGVLRVINEDRIAPASGFGTHGHRDMEIVTWVLSGTLEHRDSLGSVGRLGPGEVQWMSAGRGVMHSERNPSPSEPVHLLQIWIEPQRTGGAPAYAQQAVAPALLANRLGVLVSPDGRDGSLTMGQDAFVLAARMDRGCRLHHSLVPGRLAWAQVVRGALSLNEHVLVAGDGAAIHAEAGLDLRADDDCEVLLFDLPQA